MTEPLSDYAKLVLETAHAMQQATLAGISAGRMGGMIQAQRLADALRKVCKELDWYAPEGNVALNQAWLEGCRALEAWERQSRPADIPPGPLKGNDGNF